MKRTDVIIIGAGPAGSWLGFRLAQAGIDSVILEKEEFPRYKACGGGLSLKTTEFLPFSIEEVTERSMTGVWIRYRKKQVLISDIGPVGVMVMRDAFDNLLVKKYLEVGGHFNSGVSITHIDETKDNCHIQTENESWQGKILVGADGVSSFVRRACGFGGHQKLLVALAAEIKVPSEAMQMLGDRAYFDLNAIPDGYGWVFPKRNHLSIGVFTHRRGLDLNALLKTFCQTHPLLRDGGIFLTQGGALPVGGYPRPVQKGRVLLIGDAAATVEPFLGEGIYHALLSADIAADAIIGHLKYRRSLQVYAERFVKTIDKNIIRANRLARSFYQHLPWTFPLGVQNRIIARGFAREAIGKSDFSGWIRYCLWRLPLIPFAYRKGQMRKKL